MNLTANVFVLCRLVDDAAEAAARERSSRYTSSDGPSHWSAPGRQHQQFVRLAGDITTDGGAAATTIASAATAAAGPVSGVAAGHGAACASNESSAAAAVAKVASVSAAESGTSVGAEAAAKRGGDCGDGTKKAKTATGSVVTKGKEATGASKRKAGRPSKFTLATNAATTAAAVAASTCYDRNSSDGSTAARPLFIHCEDANHGCADDAPGAASGGAGSNSDDDDGYDSLNNK